MSNAWLPLTVLNIMNAGKEDKPSGIPAMKPWSFDMIEIRVSLTHNTEPMSDRNVIQQAGVNYAIPRGIDWARYPQEFDSVLAETVGYKAEDAIRMLLEHRRRIGHKDE